MTLGEEAACFIKSRGMTQEEFSVNVGICVGYANAIINGKIRPSEKLKNKILGLCRHGKVEECEQKHNRCYDCFYRRPMIGVGTTIYACHYMIDTGKRRGVTPQECYKHEGTPYIKKLKGMTARKSVDIVPKYGGEKMEIGLEIKKLREAKGLHQKELADKSGVGINTLRAVEKGKTLKLDTLSLIAKALGKKIKVTLE